MKLLAYEGNDKKLYRELLKETCIKSVWIDNNQLLLRKDLKILMKCLQSFVARHHHPKLFFAIRHIKGAPIDYISKKPLKLEEQEKDAHEKKTEALLASLKVVQQCEFKDNLKELSRKEEVKDQDLVKNDDSGGEEDEGYIGDLKIPSHEKNDTVISRHGWGIEAKNTYSFYKVNQQHGLYFYQSQDGGVYVGEKRGGQKYNFVIFDSNEKPIFQWRDGHGVIPDNMKVQYQPEEWEKNDRSTSEERNRLATLKEDEKEAKKIEVASKNRRFGRSKSLSKSKSKSPGKSMKERKEERKRAQRGRGGASSSKSPDRKFGSKSPTRKK